MSLKFIAPTLYGSGGGGFTHSDYVHGLAGQGWSAAFVLICTKKDAACSNVSNPRRCTEGRVVSGAHSPQRGALVPPIHTAQGAKGWRVHLGGGSSLPDWLTFQCHSRSRRASPLPLVTGAMLACCLSAVPQSPAAVAARLWGPGAVPPPPRQANWAAPVPLDQP